MQPDPDKLTDMLEIVVKIPLGSRAFQDLLLTVVDKNNAVCCI